MREAMEAMTTFNTIRSELAEEKDPGVALRKTLVLEQILPDLLFYRYYGFRDPDLEALMSDPKITALYEQIKTEEDDAAREPEVVGGEDGAVEPEPSRLAELADKWSYRSPRSTD